MKLNSMLPLLGAFALALTACSKAPRSKPVSGGEPAADGEPVVNREETIKREQSALKQMAANGDNITTRHDITFQMSFSSKDRADKAAALIREKTFVVEVKKAPTGTDWICAAMRTMTPDAEVIEKITAELRVLAGQFEGDFDGWSAPVTK